MDKIYVVTYSWDNNEAYEDHFSNSDGFQAVFSTKEKALNYILNAYEECKKVFAISRDKLKEDYSEEMMENRSTVGPFENPDPNKYWWWTIDCFLDREDHILKVEEVTIDDNVPMQW